MNRAVLAASILVVAAAALEAVGCSTSNVHPEPFGDCTVGAGACGPVAPTGKGSGGGSTTGGGASDSGSTVKDSGSTPTDSGGGATDAAADGSRDAATTD